MTETVHRVAVVPGDGIGTQVVPAAQEIVEGAARPYGVRFDWQPFPWGCGHFEQTGAMMPPDALDQLGAHDAIFLGAVGAPGVPGHISLWVS